MTLSDIDTKALRAYGLFTAAAALALESKRATVDLRGHGSLRLIDPASMTATEIMVRVKRHEMWQGQYDNDMQRLEVVDRVVLVDALDGSLFSFSPQTYRALVTKLFDDHLEKHGGERPRTRDSQHYGLRRSDVESAAKA